MLDVFSHFMRGLLKMPLYAQIWVMLLAVVNGVVPLFYLGRVEAQATLVLLLMSAALMMIITKQTGFTRLLGAGHFLWFVLLGFLWTRLGQLPGHDVFSLWIYAVMIMNGISLVIDLVDVIRYVRGDHAEMVEGL